jgi:hypothetical protein
MNLSEPKNLRRSKASFRKSKSTMSLFSDEETNIFTSKKMKSTLGIGNEEANDLFTDRYSQDDVSLKDERFFSNPKELT